MPLSRDFKITVQERAQRDPAFRLAMLQEALQALSSGEAVDAKLLLRGFINATVGFQALGDTIHANPKSLMRMLGPNGNPSLDNLSAILKELARREGYRVEVKPLGRPPARHRAPVRARKTVRAA